MRGSKPASIFDLLDTLVPPSTASGNFVNRVTVMKTEGREFEFRPGRGGEAPDWVKDRAIVMKEVAGLNST